MDTNYINDLAKRVIEDVNFVKGKEEILQAIIENIKNEPIDINSCESRLLLARIKDLFYSNMNYELSKLLMQWATYQGNSIEKE